MIRRNLSVVSWMWSLFLWQHSTNHLWTTWCGGGYIQSFGFKSAVCITLWFYSCLCWTNYVIEAISWWQIWGLLPPCSRTGKGDCIKSGQKKQQQNFILFYCFREMLLNSVYFSGKNWQGKCGGGGQRGWDQGCSPILCLFLTTFPWPWWKMSCQGKM